MSNLTRLMFFEKNVVGTTIRYNNIEYTIVSIAVYKLTFETILLISLDNFTYVNFDDKIGLRYQIRNILAIYGIQYVNSIRLK